ncbi:MAG: phenylacetate--CoA ligase family protein [Promethearchaeota archaeon]
MLYKLLRARRKLRKNPYKKMDELEKLQLKELKKEVHIAYENTEYYHRLFDSLGLKPDDINTKEDLRKLPLTKKSTLRYNNMISKEVKDTKLIRVTTSGSTGEPVEIFFTENDIAIVAATASRVSEAAGLRTLKDRVAQLLMIGPFIGATLVKTLFGGIVKLLAKVKMISIKKPLPEIVEELLKYDPTLLSVYPSVAYSIGQYMADHDLEFPHLRTVVTGSEILNDKIRRGIEESLNAEVFDAYGITEINVFGYECSEHMGLHTNIDTAIMEVVDKNNEPVAEGERGRLILTPLMREAMPLIRYDTRDIVRAGGNECSCGRTFPLIDVIEGRAEDIIRLPAGELVYPQIVIGELGDILQLENYQVIQPQRDKIEVYLVKGKDFSDRTAEKVERICGELFKGADLKVRFTEKIKETPSARTRHIISNVGEEVS